MIIQNLTTNSLAASSVALSEDNCVGSNSYASFAGGEKIEFATPYISGTSFHFKVFVERKNLSQFLVGDSLDASNYVYIPLAGGTIELSVTGLTRVKIVYPFTVNVKYWIECRRVNKEVWFRVHQSGEREENYDWVQTTADLAANTASRFDYIGYRNVTSYFTGLMFNFQNFDTDGDLVNQWELGELGTTTDLVGGLDGTNDLAATSTSNKALDGWLSTLSVVDWLDTGTWTNTGLGYHSGDDLLMSILYDLPTLKIVKYDYSDFSVDSEIDVTALFAGINGLQGLTYDSINDRYIIIYNDNLAANVVTMRILNSTATAVVSTVLLAGVGAGSAGTITFDATLDGGAGGVWFKGASATTYRAFDLSGALLDTITFTERVGTPLFKFQEGSYHDPAENYFILGGGYGITVWHTDGYLLKEYRNPAQVTTEDAQDEGMVMIGDYLFFNTDNKTHPTAWGKDTIWKLAIKSSVGMCFDGNRNELL